MNQERKTKRGRETERQRERENVGLMEKVGRRFWNMKGLGFCNFLI